MYAFEQQIRVMLQFPGMPAPVEVSVPWNVLRYLDTHAEREFAPDGMVVYRHRAPLARFAYRTHPSLEPVLAAA